MANVRVSGAQAGYKTIMLSYLLATLAQYAFGAESWQPSCVSRDEPSIWFVLSAAAGGGSATHDYDCKGLFFADISCMQTVGLGRAYAEGKNTLGLTTYVLHYLPYGETLNILSFLNKPGTGVLFKVPTLTGLSPAAMPPPLTPEDLLRLYLIDRQKASAPTQGITLHLWSCPDAPFTPPDDVISPSGMKVVQHVALAPVAPASP